LLGRSSSALDLCPKIGLRSFLSRSSKIELGEDEKKEENLGKRVKARMKAEAEDEKEDEDDIGELPDEDEDEY